MAKNPSTGFRKIDIDQYNEDAFKDEEGAEAQSPVTGVDEQEVKRLISGGRYGEALKSLLLAAPVTSKNQAVKDNAYALVLQVLSSVKTSEMDKVLEPLDSDHVDLLMKYIYRGFENPNDNSCAHLLVWHEKAYSKGGVGSIVRVLTDKKRV
jgi:actin related protein 2/3 complex subunit 5